MADEFLNDKVKTTHLRIAPSPPLPFVRRWSAATSLPLIRLGGGDSTRRFGNVMRWAIGSGEGVPGEGGRRGIGKKRWGDVLWQRRQCHLIRRVTRHPSPGLSVVGRFNCDCELCL